MRAFYQKKSLYFCILQFFNIKTLLITISYVIKWKYDVVSQQINFKASRKIRTSHVPFLLTHLLCKPFIVLLHFLLGVESTVKQIRKTTRTPTLLIFEDKITTEVVVVQQSINVNFK